MRVLTLPLLGSNEDSPAPEADSIISLRVLVTKSSRHTLAIMLIEFGREKDRSVVQSTGALAIT